MYGATIPEWSGAPIESRPACAIARLITVSCAKVPPAPPYSSGIAAQSKPACPSLSQAERSMMPSSVHLSMCGTSSLARKRRDCSSSSTRSSVIHAGRGTCRDSMRRSSGLVFLEHDLFRKPALIPDRHRGHAFRDHALSVALIVHQMRGLVFQPFIAGLARQRVNAVDPCDL